VCCPVKEEELRSMSALFRFDTSGNGAQFTFEAVNVRITIIMLAAMTAMRPIMFIARITLRMMKPGPASRLLVRGIPGERLLLRNETVIEY
jgi:hypothetical protein